MAPAGIATAHSRYQRGKPGIDRTSMEPRACSPPLAYAALGAALLGRATILVRAPTRLAGTVSIECLLPAASYGAAMRAECAKAALIRTPTDVRRRSAKVDRRSGRIIAPPRRRARRGPRVTGLSQ